MGAVSPNTNSNSRDIAGLDLCTTYWFVARVASCESEVFSSPYKLELQDSTIFTIDFDVSELGECDTWIVANNAMKISTIEQTLNTTVYSKACGLILVQCFAGSTLSCSTNDQSVATFRYVLYRSIVFV